MPSSSFFYEPLSTESDCTRFIQIEPVQSDDEPVSCRLTQIAFGERPRFDAVSYMWGDSEPDDWRKIILNGVEFHLRRNLWEALRHLRNGHDSTLFWIDAICIDQDNLAERNRQVRIMGQIYFRAQTVVVWLGSKYAKYQQHLQSEDLQCTATQTRNAEVELDPSTAHQGGIETQGTGAWFEEREMAKTLLEDRYWERLWIIQEVAQALVLKLSFGTWDWTWDSLIHFLTMHNLGEVGPLTLPLRLNRQLRQARTTGFSICQLFKDHH